MFETEKRCFNKLHNKLFTCKFHNSTGEKVKSEVYSIEFLFSDQNVCVCRCVFIVHSIVIEFQITLNHISLLIRCRLDLSLPRQSQGSLWHTLCVGVRTWFKLFLQVLYLNYNLLYIHQTCMFNASGSTKDLNGSDAESRPLILDAEGD